MTALTNERIAELRGLLSSYDIGDLSMHAHDGLMNALDELLAVRKQLARERCQPDRRCTTTALTDERIEEIVNRLKLKVIEYGRAGIDHFAIHCKDAFDVVAALADLQEARRRSQVVDGPALEMIRQAAVAGQCHKDEVVYQPPKALEGLRPDRPQAAAEPAREAIGSKECPECLGEGKVEYPGSGGRQQCGYCKGCGVVAA